jgi:hypothetical protein
VALDWTAILLDQLDGHWNGQLRPRLDGLTDDEYFWEPAPGCWNVRRRGESPIGVGGGSWTIDVVRPWPSVSPVTTIAWRLGHLSVVLGRRLAGHFGGADVSYDDFSYGADAGTALGQLDQLYWAWIAGVAALNESDLAQWRGPEHSESAALPMAELVLHISREVIHHGAEVALLRDLFRTSAARGGRDAT